MSRTMFDKIWSAHVVDDLGDNMQLMYVTRHVMHELSGHRGQIEIRKRGLKMRRADLTIGSFDHVVSTEPGARGGPAAWADQEPCATVAALPEPQQWAAMERINTRNGCHFFTACRPERPRAPYSDLRPRAADRPRHSRSSIAAFPHCWRTGG